MYLNTISVFDSTIYSSLFTQKEMKIIWSDQYLIHCWLTFEKQIAKAQSELGIIPTHAAEEIAQACDSLIINREKMAEQTALVGMAIKPLIDQISAHGGPLVKKYIHWGCTTQDLLDTALAMRMKETLRLIRLQFIELGKQLVDMATQHRHTVMVARTNAIDASATTWGLQVTSYLNEISRHIQRLDTIYPRISTALYGGAVGNLASVGTQGLKLRKRLCELLELNEPKGFNNASLDHVVELVQFFALIHGTLVRLANDIECMSRTSILEATEGRKGGGSSTMPHKSNPRGCNMIQTLCKMGWMYASGAPNMLDQQDVRSASMRTLNWTILPESSLTVATSLEYAKELCQHLIIYPENMRKNFNASHNFIMSESVMMHLASKIGRDEAYKSLQRCLKRLNGDKLSLEQLLKNDEISRILTHSEIELACNPEHYLGSNDELIDEAIYQFYSSLT